MHKPLPATRDAAAPPAAPGSQPSRQLVTFTLGTEEFGIPILAVKEIRGWTPETRLPNLPPHVRGVINLRGVIVPIFDLRARFGGPQTEATRRHVVIVLTIGERLQGILTDAISDILDVADGDILPAPNGDGGLVDRAAILGLVASGNRMVTVLDLGRLFAAETQALDEMQDTMAGTAGA